MDHPFVSHLPRSTNLLRRVKEFVKQNGKMRGEGALPRNKDAKSKDSRQSEMIQKKSTQRVDILKNADSYHYSEIMKITSSLSRLLEYRKGIQAMGRGSEYL